MECFAQTGPLACLKRERKRERMRDREREEERGREKESSRKEAQACIIDIL